MSHVIALVAFSFVTFLAGYGAAAWTDRRPRSHPWPITHQHNGWHDHPLVDLGDATAATEPHVHRRRAEPPDSGDGAAPVDLDRLAFALWEEFGGGQLDENDDRPPERLGPEHEYWPAAANRVLGTVRNINANIVRNIAAIAAIRSGSPAPEGGE